MTPSVLPKCVECQKTESLLWRNVDQGQICQECFELKDKASELSSDVSEQQSNQEKSKDTKDKEQELNDNAISNATNRSTSPGNVYERKKLRKSTRSTRFKARMGNSASANANGNGNNVGSGSGTAGNATGNNKSQNKGRNRRHIFKRTPFKTPTVQVTTRGVESVFHKGSYLQVGDIVSLVDNDQNVYYAQIRGLLVDNYCEKSAFLTWLIPTHASPDPRNGFDAATYLIGTDEDLSRKLSCIEFVMHAPSNYYLDRSTPFPLPDNMDQNFKQGGYIWTTLPAYRR